MGSENSARIVRGHGNTVTGLTTSVTKCWRCRLATWLWCPRHNREEITRLHRRIAESDA